MVTSPSETVACRKRLLRAASASSAAAHAHIAKARMVKLVSVAGARRAIIATAATDEPAATTAAIRHDA